MVEATYPGSVAPVLFTGKPAGQFHGASYAISGQSWGPFPCAHGPAIPCLLLADLLNWEFLRWLESNQLPPAFPVSVH